MTNIRYISYSCAVLFVLGLTCSTPAHAAVSVDEAVQKIITTLHSKIKNQGEFQAKFCRKASALSGIVSIRSLGGIACEDKVVAALAVATCGGFEDFDSSQCHTEAAKVLGDDGMADPINVLATAAQNGTGKARDLICQKTENLPDNIKAKATAACGIAGANSAAQAQAGTATPAPAKAASATPASAKKPAAKSKVMSLAGNKKKAATSS